MRGRLSALSLRDAETSEMQSPPPDCDDTVTYSVLHKRQMVRRVSPEGLWKAGDRAWPQRWVPHRKELGRHPWWQRLGVGDGCSGRAGQSQAGTSGSWMPATASFLTRGHPPGLLDPRVE